MADVIETKELTREDLIDSLCVIVERIEKLGQHLDNLENAVQGLIEMLEQGGDEGQWDATLAAIQELEALKS